MELTRDKVKQYLLNLSDQARDNLLAEVSEDTVVRSDTATKLSRREF